MSKEEALQDSKSVCFDIFNVIRTSYWSLYKVKLYLCLIKNHGGVWENGNIDPRPFISALDRWLVSRPGYFTPGRKKPPFLRGQEAGCSPEPVWTPHRTQTPASTRNLTPIPLPYTLIFSPAFTYSVWLNLQEGSGCVGELSVASYVVWLLSIESQKRSVFFPVYPLFHLFPSVSYSSSVLSFLFSFPLPVGGVWFNSKTFAAFQHISWSSSYACWANFDFSVRLWVELHLCSLMLTTKCVFRRFNICHNHMGYCTHIASTAENF
jgi:hypothetical protein